MKFRPCIDIHNGQVKQIVGGSLCDEGNAAQENFVSHQDATYYANLYKNSDLQGGHIILLNPVGSEYYNEDKRQASIALHEFPGGLQLGGGITDKNAKEFLDMGASHVIVTSHVFSEGAISYDNLKRLCKVTGKEHLVLDLSCRKKDGIYYIVTNRWQKFTDIPVKKETLDYLCDFADEFLIHAVDVEGKASGIELELAQILGKWAGIPITYAGGIGSFADLELLQLEGNGKLDFTIGSALDLFGGDLSYQEIVRKYAKNNGNTL